MFDVIKIRLKSKDEMRNGKGNPKKELDNRGIFKTSHMELSA